MAANPLDFINKTFLQLYNELQALYADKPDWFKTLLSGRADILHWYIDARANNLTLGSAFTEKAISKLLELINYYLSPASAATVNIQVTLKAGTSLPHIVSKENLIFTTPGTTDVPPIRFEAAGSHTFNALTEEVFCTEGETISDEVIGKSDNSQWQTFDLSRKKVLKGSSNIEITPNTWTEILGSFIDYESTDRVYRIINRTDDTAYVEFSNGTIGAIPPPNIDISITYRTGGGINGNVKAGEINTYIGGDAAIESVTNLLQASGGSEKESIERARRLAPQLLAAQNRNVKTRDTKSLSEDYPGVARVGVIKNKFGFFSEEVQIVPFGGGYPSSLLKTDLQAVLIDLSPLESIDVRTADPNYVTISITAQVKLLVGYDWSKIQSYTNLAFNLLLSETFQEIRDTYESSGISEAVTLINSIFSTTYGQADFEQIENIIIKVKIREWGENINSSDMLAVDGYINGIDYLIISSPAFPIIIDFDETTTNGTHVITEIS